MSDTQDEGKGVIAERLDHLFAEIRPKGPDVRPPGRPYTLQEAVDGINEKAGEPLISVQYLSQLRKGDRRRPSLEVLRAIAAWFGVRVHYFTDDETASRTDEELHVLKMMRDAGVRDIFFRTDGVSQRSLEAVKAMLDTLRDLEGLPPVSPDDEPGSADR